MILPLTDSGGCVMRQSENLDQRLLSFRQATPNPGAREAWLDSACTINSKASLAVLHGIACSLQGIRLCRLVQYLYIVTRFHWRSILHNLHVTDWWMGTGQTRNRISPFFKCSVFPLDANFGASSLTLKSVTLIMFFILSMLVFDSLKQNIS